MTDRSFHTQPFPRKGSFVVRKNIEVFVRALELAPKGGYIGIRGYACFVMGVDVHKDGSATVRFERVKQSLLKKQGFRTPMLPTMMNAH